VRDSVVFASAGFAPVLLFGGELAALAVLK
jgi:hypothetical protein